jgi:hypothetical protein
MQNTTRQPRHSEGDGRSVGRPIKTEATAERQNPRQPEAISGEIKLGMTDFSASPTLAKTLKCISRSWITNPVTTVSPTLAKTLKCVSRSWITNPEHVGTTSLSFRLAPVPTSLPAAAQIPIPYRSQQLLRGGSDYGFLNWPTKKQPRLNPTQTTSIITHGLTLRLEICSSVLPRQYFPESLVQYLCSSEPFGMLKI